MTPTLSIVTGTVDRPDCLKKLIESIERNTKWPECELVISDAGEIPAVINSTLPIRILREQPRLGHGLGYNNAFWACRGRWVIWLNDDCTVEPGWASEAISFMEANPWCGLGALYYSENGCCWHINQYQGMIYANFGIILRDFGNFLGWFDTDCGKNYGLDNALTFKTILAGRGIGGIPNARIKHYPINDKLREVNVAGQADDARLLMNKYRSSVDYMQAIQSRFPKSHLTVR